MANWCSNHIEITGLTQTQADIMEDALKENILLETYVPIPEEASHDRLEWAYSHWGTKWIDVIDVKRTDNTISAAFSSAWAPPLEAIATIASKFYPDALFTIDYEEGGMNFMGVVMIKADTFAKAEGPHTRNIFHEFLISEGRTEDAALWEEGDITDELEDEFEENELEMMDAMWNCLEKKCLGQMAAKAVAA